MIVIDLCPICGSDVSHFFDASGNMLFDEHGISLYACEYPWQHPTPETDDPAAPRARTVALKKNRAPTRAKVGRK